MRATYYCAECDRPLYFEDQCYEMDGQYYCPECMENHRKSVPEPEIWGDNDAC